MILYNAKAYAGGYRITKFDAWLNVEASYLIKYIDASPICDCPSWPRKNTCKHCEMFRKFMQREYLGTDWFYNADNDSWHRPITVAKFMLGEFFSDLADGPHPPSDPADSPSAGPEAAEGLPPAPSAVSRRRLIS